MPTIGSLAVILTADAATFDKHLKKARRSLRNFEYGIRDVRRGIQGFALAIAGTLAYGVREFVKQGDYLAKHAKQIGVTAEMYAGLQYAAELAGTSEAAVGKAIVRLTRNIYDAGRGLSTAIEGFEDLAVNWRELKGLAPAEQFLKVADALKDVEDHSLKIALAQTLMGRSAAELIPMFQQGTAALREQIAEGIRLTGISNEQAQLAEDLQDEWTRMTRAMKSAAVQAGAALAPALLEVAENIKAQAIEAREWIRQNPQYIMTLAKTAVTLLKIVAALWAMEKAAKAARTGLLILTMTRAKFVALLGAINPVTAAFGVLAIGIGAAYLQLRHWNDEAARFIDKAPDPRMGIEALREQLRLRQLTREGLIKEIAEEKAAWRRGILYKPLAIHLIRVGPLKAQLEAEKRAIKGLISLIQELEGVGKVVEPAKPSPLTPTQEVIKALREQAEMLATGAAGLQAYQLAALKASDAEIALAESLRRYIETSRDIDVTTGGLAEQARALEKSLRLQVDTFGMSAVEAQIYRLESELVSEQQKLQRAIMAGTTKEFVEQMQARIALTFATLESAKALDAELTILEEWKRGVTSISRMRSARPAALELGTVAAYSASLRTPGMTRMAKSADDTAKATQSMDHTLNRVETILEKIESQATEVVDI